VPEVPKALADMPLEAGIAREEDLGVVHRTVREARHTGQQEGLEAERHTVLDVVRQVQRAEVAGSPAEDDHRIGQVGDLEGDHRSLLGTAGLVERRSQVDRNLAVGVLRSCQSVDLMPGFNPLSESRILTGRLAVSLLRSCAPWISRRYQVNDGNDLRG
jgi:hypothetical protein